MGLMDKVKAQAAQLAQQTQQTARDSMAKFDQSNASRRADALFRNLGALVFAERTGRGGPDAQAQIDKLVADLSAHEAQNGINLAQQVAPVDAMQGTGFQDPGPTSTLNFGDAPPAVVIGDPAAATSFPSSATSFPESGTPTSVPDSGGATSFPSPGTPTSFPGSGTATSFPSSGTPTSFPESAPATAFPESGTPTSVPDSQRGTSHPESGSSGS